MGQDKSVHPRRISRVHVATLLARVKATGGRNPGRTLLVFEGKLGNGPQRTAVRSCACALLAASISILGALSLAVAAPPAGAANWAPVSPKDFPDPSVLHAPTTGTYYAFATQNFASATQTINIQESTSPDGINWTPSGVDPLPNLGSWARPGDTWAPSVAYNGSEYVMYYTATEASAPSDQCIGVATSPTPGGPYTTSSPEPVVCQDGDDVSPTVDNGNYGGSIDPDIFSDSSGSSWLIWKSDGNHIGISTTIWSVPLAPDLLMPSSASPASLLTNHPGTWEGSVIEGPDMIQTGAHAYDLLFSGNQEGTASYAIGWASCSGPAGPCGDETTSGPLLSSAPGMSGPGGPDVYSLSDGETRLAFSAWEGTTIGYLSCGVRPMYLADITFGGGGQPLLSDPDPGVRPASGPTCPQPQPGYWQVASDGGVFTFGAANFYGSTGAIKLNQPVVGMAATPDGHGYWLVARDGGVFAFGDAGFFGSTGAMVLNKPIIGMMNTLDGRGYWLIASDGGVFAFGDATYYGSMGGDAPPSPITAAAPGYLGGGYWMVDAEGQVFSFGDASYWGAPASAPDGYTISGMAPTHDDHGYWLSSWNGNVAGFGDAAPYGSMYGRPLNGPVIGITATRDGGGYWLQGSDGGIFSFGDAPFLGSMGGVRLNAPVVGIASF